MLSTTREQMIDTSNIIMALKYMGNTFHSSIIVFLLMVEERLR